MSHLDRLLDRSVTLVTRHNRLTLVLLLLATAVVVPGVTQLETGDTGGLDLDTQTEIAAAGDYVDANYGGEESETALANVYVSDADGNALSKGPLLEALRYQRAVRSTDAVSERLAGGVRSPATVVARQLSSTAEPSLETQIEAVKTASPAAVERAVATAFDGGERTRVFLPQGYDPQTGAAESFRLVVPVTPAEDGGVPTAVTERLHTQTADHGGTAARLFTVDDAAREGWLQQRQSDTLELVVVPALLLVVLVLGITYRDLVDVVIGFLGVALSVLWTFGILGWLGISPGLALVVGPVLIIALSIDFGLHVFMRYREERGPEEGIQAPMDRSTSSVAVAFTLVTVTAAIGFLSNLVSPVTTVKQLGIGITLGVISAFILFVTLVPALKVSVDGLLERVGLNRRKRPLGDGRLVGPVLSAGGRLARRAAPVVVVVALVGGAAGGVAYTDLDRQGIQTGGLDVADWKTELPGPLAWESANSDYQRDLNYVIEQYQSADDDASLTAFLVEGSVTTETALDRVAAGTSAAAETEVVFRQGDRVPVRSPLSVMRSVARTDEAFARTFDRADTDGDGVPDRGIETVYDTLYEAAPDRAAQVIERTDGEYRSLLLSVPVQQSAGLDSRGEAMHDIAAETRGETDLTVTPVSQATLLNSQLAVLADGILRTMALALAAVAALLAVVYRLRHGSATLGLLTVVPIALVVGLTFGGMALLEVPLTFLTALLLSVGIGLGVDYSIHVTDRFVEERTESDPATALDRALTGTGGALLGSMLTSAVSFSALLLHPNPQLQSFGVLVMLALGLSFLLSVYVLPSLLWLWARRVDTATPAPEADPAIGDD